MWWALIVPPALAMGPGECRTMALLPDKPPLDRTLLAARPAAPGDKATRDDYGLPNSLESDNFVIRWGSSASPREADLQAMLDGFEEAWAVEVEEMDHPSPAGCDQYKFNVYVGDSGSGAPSSGGAAGYYWTDPAGYPMIVLSTYTVANPDYGVTTTAHEFYHAIQDTTASYGYGSGEGSWYWEATACWIESEVFPDNMGYAEFLFGYAYLPHLPLGFFDYPDSGALQEYHQYGAFIFPRFLVEYVTDWSLIRDTWVEPAGGTDDPIEALRAELSARGADFDLVFTDFAAHNAAWDYSHGEAYEAVLEAYDSYFDSEEIAQDVGAEGTGGWATVSEDLLPQRYGYDVIRMRNRQDGDLVVGFQGDLEGSKGTEAEWGVVMVREDDGVPSYEWMELSAGEGEITVVGGSGRVYLVVAAWGDRLRDGETFGFAYRMDYPAEDTGVAPPDQRTSEGVVCACGMSGRAGAGLPLVMAPLVLSRRRQR